MIDCGACPSDVYDYIIFYRWLSPDGMYERGRVMARLVTEMMKTKSRRVWLDQLEMQRTMPPDEVIGRIADTFLWVSQVIILAAPGDWHRFADPNDIHRWEWELSLRSDKKIWLLQYGLPDGMEPLSEREIVTNLQDYYPHLAELASKKRIQARVLTMDNIDGTLREIAEGQ
ncbi:hypothetical protein BDV28DRAFT_117274 [Aspergillus coremiiformis]|uniref:TIR domain-containing protein n=1 Tax=Aspergillus coremiiformis TaxID=138285 RepID=A0A5N6ZHB7_9EURO|nr:hypothetical protein BDV28DRAFT_117274 [Aspergillus coremiiformis]